MARAWRLVALAASMVGAVACDDDEPPPPAAPKDAGFEASDLCPNAEDPRVHYRDKDPAKCKGVSLDCTSDQNGFQSSCGCGCIDKGGPLCPPVDDPAIEWVWHDPAKCGPAPPTCRPDQTPFNNACGCGCTNPGS